MKYTIELVADSKGLQPAIDGLEQVADKNKEVEDGFKNGATQVGKFGSALDKLLAGYKKTSQAAVGAFGSQVIDKAGEKLKLFGDKLALIGGKKYDDIIAAQKKLNDEVGKQPEVKPPLPPDTPQKVESFRTQLRQSRDEIIKLMQSGQLSTAEIYRMAKGAGELKDSMGDAQQAISVLASDTFKLDAALQGIQVGAAGFQVMQGAAALFGSESEELQKTLVKLNAVMAVTNGLKQIQDGLQKSTALSLGLETAAQEAYGFVVGTSTGALKAFRIALAATGIGLAVIAIAALVTNWDKLKVSIFGAKKSLEDFNKELDKRKDATQAYVSLYEKQLKLEVLSGRITEEEGKKRLIAYKKQIAEQYEGVKRQQQLVDDLKAKYGEYYDYQKSIGNKDILREEAKLDKIKNLKTDELLSLKESEQDLVDFQADQAQKAADAKKKRDEDAVKAAREAEEKRLEIIRQGILDEIALQEVVVIEMKNNDKEKLKAEQTLATLKGKLALFDAKTEAEKELVRTQTLNAIAELSDKYYKDEQERIDKNKELFAKSEQEKADAKAKANEEMIESDKKRAEAEEKNRKKAEEEAKKRREKEQEDRIAIINEVYKEVKLISDTIFGELNERRNDEYNARIAQLEKERDAELKNKDLSENQKARINERYEKKIAEQKRKQAEENKKAAIAQAVINGALAITNILATMNWATFGVAQAIAIASTVAATAAQIATISAQKIPQFAKGTEFVNGGGTETSDSIPAMLSKGERVVPAHINKMLKGIPNDMLPEMLMPSKTLIGEGMDYDKLAKAFSKELASNPQLMVNFDKRGFETFIKNGNTTSQVKNSRNDF